MSQVILSTITTIANSLGISHLKESVASKISSNVKREILKVLGDTFLMMRLEHNTRLKPKYLNQALEANHLEPLFGYENSKNIQIENAGTIDALDLLAYIDYQVPLEFFQRFELKQYPIDTTFDLEWLSIFGNKVNSEIKNDEDNSNENKDEASHKKEQQNHNLLPNLATKNRISNLESDITISSKHSFSYELKLYYQTARKYLLSDEVVKREKMLKHLKVEKCLETLVPYFIQFSQTIIVDYPNDFDKLYLAVSVAKALTKNDDISIDIYLQSMISIALTLLVSDKIKLPQISDNFMIKTYACDLLKSLVDKAVVNYPNVQPTITTNLLSVLIDDKEVPYGIPQKFGAASALFNFGLDTVSSYLFPTIPKLLEELESISQISSSYYDDESIIRFYDILLASVGHCIESDTIKLLATGIVPLNPKSMPNNNENYYQLIDIFGADLIPYCIDESSILYI